MTKKEKYFKLIDLYKIYEKQDNWEGITMLLNVAEKKFTTLEREKWKQEYHNEKGGI